MVYRASTLQFTFDAIDDAIAWYSRLFARDADFVSSAEFQEWEVFPDFWLQIAKGEVISSSPRLRLGVEDVEAEKVRLETDLGLEVDNRFHTPKVVLLYNFTDPWGYRLGIFQDLQLHPLKTST